MRCPFLGVVTIALLSGQLPARDGALAGYRLAEGWNGEVVAVTAVATPRRVSFLDDGTPLVVERVKNKDVLKALSSSKPGGPWDRARVVLEADVLADVLALDGWVYVAGSGGIRRVRPGREGEPTEPPVGARGAKGDAFLKAAKREA